MKIKQTDLISKFKNKISQIDDSDLALIINDVLSKLDFILEKPQATNYIKEHIIL
ncbi:hypothetical protein OFQ66_12160 [Brachyspira hyodysenteriae]|nr:hypothetical protein [Brachyspira hyodysenteriae]